jgi:predicted nucleic acid-binding OB-fold protein
MKTKAEIFSRIEVLEGSGRINAKLAVIARERNHFESFKRHNERSREFYDAANILRWVVEEESKDQKMYCFICGNRVEFKEDEEKKYPVPCNHCYAVIEKSY